MPAVGLHRCAPAGPLRVIAVRSGAEHLSVDAVEVVRIEVRLRPLVVCRQEPACRHRGLALIGRDRSFGRGLARLARASVEEVEVVDKPKRLYGEDCGDVGVVDGQEIVPVRCFAARCQVPQYTTGSSPLKPHTTNLWWIW